MMKLNSFYEFLNFHQQYFMEWEKTIQYKNQYRSKHKTTCLSAPKTKVFALYWHKKRHEKPHSKLEFIQLINNKINKTKTEVIYIISNFAHELIMIWDNSLDNSAWFIIMQVNIYNINASFSGSF